MLVTNVVHQFDQFYDLIWTRTTNLPIRIPPCYDDDDDDDDTLATNYIRNFHLKRMQRKIIKLIYIYLINR
jgi:hypothetical protein